ncbi:MAG: hypothetical protein J2P17_16675 [Mycobacterium sp.]|nr:hypothetical protein [Mycobacterium sp.]
MATGEESSGLAQAAIEAGVMPEPVSNRGGNSNGDIPEAEVVEPAPGSVLAALRERAAQLRTEQTTDLDIPGYNGLLVGRYKAVSLGRIFAKSQTIQTPLNPAWTMAADTLAGALVELFMRDDPDSDELHPLFKDISAKFDDDLVDALNLHPEARTGRAVLVALCGGGALGETRVWAHYMQYQGWLLAGVEGESAEQAVVSQAVGESLPT